MTITLSDKHALVGASSKGLGQAIGTQLAKCGASVTFVGRDENRLQSICNMLNEETASQHRYLVIDYYDFEAYCSLINAHISAHPVDILVNNTPGPPAGGIENLTLEDYEKANELLFKVHVHTTTQVYEYMKTQRYGRIINVGSVTIKQPSPMLVLSNTMRSALQSWSKTLAKELAPFGITVNTLLTGYFDTERLQSLLKVRAEQEQCTLEEMQAQLYDKVPVGRFGKVEEYAYLCAFLASPYASYITGSSIPVDGGLLDSL